MDFASVDGHNDSDRAGRRPRADTAGQQGAGERRPRAGCRSPRESIASVMNGWSGRLV